MADSTEHRLHIEGPGKTDRLRLPSGRLTIGRVEGNNLVLPHRFVSSRHAQIENSGDGCYLVDLESTNGTTLNGVAVEPGVSYLVEPGSTIKIGPFVLVLEQAELQPAIPPETIPPGVAINTADIAPPGRPELPAAGGDGVQPPSEPPLAPPEGNIVMPDPAVPPPGLAHQSQRLLNYLPGIYHTDFTARFLGIFEAILTPIEWTVDNMDLYLSPHTSPADFLPWLANWYEIVFDHTWSIEKRRALLAAAPQIYGRRGTRWALAQVLEIYTGVQPDIVEFEHEDEPFSFTIRLPLPQESVNRALLEQLIDANKPAHTTYRLQFAG